MDVKKGMSHPDAVAALKKKPEKGQGTIPCAGVNSRAKRMMN